MATQSTGPTRDSTLATISRPPTPPAAFPRLTETSADTGIVGTERSSSFKRPRVPSPTSPARPYAGKHDGYPAKVARFGATTHLSPPKLTGVAALQEDRRQRDSEARRRPPATSPNPERNALSNLMSGGPLAMSRPSEAPPSSPAARERQSSVRNTQSSVSILQPNVSDARLDISPRSAAASIAGAPSITSGDPSRVVDSPGPIDTDTNEASREHPRFGQHLEPQVSDKQQSISLSYPGILPPSLQRRAPAPQSRGMSLPGSSPKTRSPSSSNKKYKCNECTTEFTRQHNLKSHLLTHSQEKPFRCDHCNHHFRRLHDLKRHSKSHTGVKDHICPICKREFARGDALARHTKGAGGCTARRASMSSHMGDGEDDTSNIGADEMNDSFAMEGDRRRSNLPTFNNASTIMAVPTSPQAYAPSSTYPPVGLRPPERHPSIQLPKVPPPANIMAGGGIGITESPQPISPGPVGNKAPAHEQSHPTQYSHSHYNRRGHELPLPVAQVSGQSRIPSGPAEYVISRTSSGPSQHNSGDSTANLFASNDQGGIWSYAHSLEERVKHLTERVTSLEKKEMNQENQVALLNSAVAALQKQVELQRHETETMNRP